MAVGSLAGLTRPRDSIAGQRRERRRWDIEEDLEGVDL